MTARRWRDLAAVIAIGVVVVGAALVPAFTANSGERVTVRGDVTMAGKPLAFFPVGFWVPDTGRADTGVLATGSTDADGAFTLEVPATVDGFAYAGTAPDSAKAIVRTVDGQVVRGIIGAKPASPIATPLYQGWPSATGRRLAAGTLHFVLQAPGTVAGTSPLAGSAAGVQVRRLDGSIVQKLEVDARGRFASASLAPGSYVVALVPAAPLLPTTAAVTVTSGKATQVTLPRPVTGATVDGAVTAGESPAPADVPVLLTQEDELVAASKTDADGHYRFTGVGEGDYTVLVGVSTAEFGRTKARGATVVLPTPTVTPTATPTASPTPTPSPTASTPEQAALAPRASGVGIAVPAETEVAVPGSLGQVQVGTVVDAIGSIGGSVTGSDGAVTQVVAQDPATGRVLRSTTVDVDGRYRIAGLARGTEYTVRAVSRPSDLTLAKMGDAVAVAGVDTSGVDIELDEPALTVSGTVASATAGTVTVGDGSFERTAEIDASGAYAVQALVPGAYPVTDTTKGRLESDPVPLVVPDDTEDLPAFDLQPGPAPGAFAGWFISGGSGVPVVSGTATDTAGDVATFGPESESGRVTVRGLRPGTYTYDADGFGGTVPAVDGPWWFAAPTGTFAIRDGATTNAGPIVLHVRAR